MVDELRLNTKFIGFDGIIGRYDYALNLIFLGAINLLFTLPLTAYYMSKVETLFDFFNLPGVLLEAPIILKSWIFIGGLVSSYIIVSNIIRRLNDINGRINKNANIIVSVIFVLAAFWMLFPFFIDFLLYIIVAVLGFYLIFKKGKITGKFSYDYRKEFNWGAFFGTWIWGLFNKSYHTLWMLILWITPWGFLFSLYCGMKGNEWAANNRDWQNLEEFQKSQETQTIVFVILKVLVLPIVYFLLVMAIVGLLMFAVVDEAKNTPEHKSATLEKLDSTLNSFASVYFESHTITEDENKFYVLPADWNSYSFSEKKDILDLAASMSASERKRLDSKKYYSKSSELNRTKIYSVENNELLGEYYFDESLISSDKPDIKNVVKASMKAYRFYNPTQKKERKKNDN